MDIEALVKQVQNNVGTMLTTQTTLTNEVKALTEQVAGASGDIKIGKEALEAVNKLAADFADTAKQIVDIEQKIAQGVETGKTAPKTLGQLVIATEEFKQYAAGNGRALKVEIQNNTLLGTGYTPTDTLVGADRLAGLVGGAFRRLRLVDVIPGGDTNSNMIEYVRERYFTNAAVEVAEGASKPEAAMDFELKTAPVRTIAHWLKVSKQLREDAPALVSYIDTRLRYGVDLRLENQILTGAGTGSNLLGLLKGDNYTAYSPTAGNSYLDTLNEMKYEVDASDYQADLVILHPRTWGKIERIKGTDGHYVIGDPRSPIGPFLWGMPVVVTNAMVEDKAHVSNIETLAQLWKRQGTVVEVFEQDDVNVQKNLLTIRAECRAALAVYRPASCRYGALASPGASA